MEAPKTIWISNWNVRTVVSWTPEIVIHKVDVIMKWLNSFDSIDRTILMYSDEKRPYRIPNNEVLEHAIATFSAQVHDLTEVLENTKWKIINSSTRIHWTQLFDFLEHNWYLNQWIWRFNYVPRDGLARLSIMPSYQIWNELSTKFWYRWSTYGDKSHDFLLSLLWKSKDIPIYSCSEVVWRPKKVDNIVKKVEKWLKSNWNRELIKLLRDFQKRWVISDLDVGSWFFVPLHPFYSREEYSKLEKF